MTFNPYSDIALRGEPVIVLDTAHASSYAPNSTTAKSWSWRQLITEQANRRLLVLVSWTSSTADAGKPTSVVGAIEGVGTWPLKEAAGHSARAGTGAYTYLGLWFLDGPLVGAMTLTVERAGTTACKPNCTSIVAGNVDLTVPPVAVPFAAHDAPLSTYALAGAKTTDANQIVVAAVLTSLRSGTLTWTETGCELAPSDPAVLRKSSGENTFTTLGYANFAAAGEALSLGYAVAGGLTAWTRSVGVAMKTATNKAAQPIYYVDAAAGHDLNDGLSPQTAWRSIDRVNSIWPFQPGTKAFFRRGQIHRRDESRFVSSALPMLAWVATAAGGHGTADLPIVLGAYGDGERPMIGGDVLCASGWTALDGTEGASPYANSYAQKRSMGAGFQRLSFPSIDGKMHQPACWSPNGYSLTTQLGGHPSSIEGWYISDKGSDAYLYPGDVNCQAGSNVAVLAADASKKVRFCRAAGVTTISIVMPEIGDHYGADSPVGCLVAYRQNPGNSTEIERIDSYDQATGTISWTKAGASYPAAQDFYFSIIGHPKDLVKRGQFAWNTDNTVCMVSWLTGAEKSVAKFEEGPKIVADHLQISDLRFGRLAGHSVDQGTIKCLDLGGNDCVLRDVKLEQVIHGNGSRGILFDADTPSARWDIDNIEFEDIPFTGGLRLLGLTYSDLNTVWGRRMGASAYYCGNTSNNNTATNIDFCEHLSRHGNGVTFYQTTHHNTVTHYGGMGSTSPYTSQVQDDPIAGGKHSTLTHSILASSRPINPVVGVPYSNPTPILRVDEGESDGLFDRVIGVLGDQAGLSISAIDDQTNDRLVIRRSVLHALSMAPKGAPGAAVDTVLALNPVYRGKPLDWAASGATVTGGSQIDTGQTWLGAPTAKMQMFVTSNGAGGFVDVVMGPASWGWTIPAFPSVGAMIDLKLTTMRVSLGTLPGRTVGHVICARPGSTIAKAEESAVNDNAHFELDRGVIFMLRSPDAPGGLTLELVETNPAASNGPTRRSYLRIAVEGEVTQALAA